VQRPALRKYDDDTHGAEGEEEGDCGFAEAFEGFFNSYFIPLAHLSLKQ
jgi:hypothetical protein